jgi:protoheme ferro-lyase
MNIWFMIDNNLIHVVNTSITDKAKRLHHHDRLLVYSAHGFSVKLKRESLNRKKQDL